MRKLFFVLLCCFSSINYAQDFSIKGVLTDKTDGASLESATIYAEKVNDSSLVTYSISGKKGDFILKGNTAVKKLRLHISYTGYEDYTKEIALTPRDIDLGSIQLGQSAESLDGIFITATRAPVTIKKDTLEFNVASFKTKKDANVEDLLRELPGVEVAEDGSIKVNGKPVNQILVNGKSFFGDDPTIATKNLTKEMIDKIQVVDTKTESEAFTGEGGDEENKTINITIDEEKNKGIFGRVSAGGGTDERFELAGLVNYFNNDVRISVLGGANNTNTPGFSFGELDKMFGGANSISISSGGAINFGGRQFGGAQGITTSRVGGFNYADDLGKETDITADYFYTSSNSFNDEIRNRENILPDNRFFSNNVSNTDRDAIGHNANIRFKTQIDSTFLINIRPEFRRNTGRSRFSNSEETTQVDGALTNQSATSRTSENERVVFENRITATKKYGSKGGYFRLTIENEIENSIDDNFLLSNTEIFGDNPEIINRNQLTNSEGNDNVYSISSRFRYPIISKKFFADAMYEYSYNKREDLTSVFDFNEITQEYSDFNLEQSTDFENIDERIKPEVGLNYRGEKLRASIRAGYVMRTLESKDGLRDIDFENDFNALELRSNLRYKFSDKFSAYSGYSLSNNAPNVRQLSPFVDISNPLNIVQGNPNLKPSNRHSFYGGANSYDYQTQSGFWSYANFSITNDNAVTRTTVDENFIRNTTYANVNGAYNFNANIGYDKTKKIDSLRSIKLGAGVYVRGNQSVNFNNDEQYKSNTTSFGSNIGVGFIWKDLFEFRPSYEFTYNNNTFDLTQFEDQEYFEHNARLRTSLTYPKNLEWSNNINYNYNPNIAEGFQRSAIFWNSSVTYSVFKDKGLLTLKVYDLLKQNTNARRTSNQDYIQDVQSTVLQQYFLLSFSYKFNTLGKKGETSYDDF